MSDYLESLNIAQREAVTHIDGPLLILAGAGSGKTKTLTTRLAYLIDEVGILPQSTLTLTFTNKASVEMRDRALSLIKHRSHFSPLLCTFHRFGLFFLRMYISYLHRGFNFVLIDALDQKNIIKQKSNFPVSYVKDCISNFKNQLITPEEALSQSEDKRHKEIALIYRDYEKQLLEQNLIDFDDLLLLPFRILNENEELALQVSQQYNYIMVDEYQDTNHLQFRLLQKLCSVHQNLVVVGDDDQSIYSWRGADIRNILDFKSQFSGAKIIKLEENYRSTEQILEVANTLIAHNSDRLGKVLKSRVGTGDKVELLHFEDGKTESLKIAQKIKKLQQEGVLLSEIAILFRLNALSRGLEEGLSQEKIPFKLVGTIRFYERSEIKDMLAYLRYLVNVKDDFSLQRIINTPKRGIGKVTQEKIFSLASKRGMSVYALFSQGEYDEILSQKNQVSLREFFSSIEILRDFLETPQILLKRFFEEIDFLNSYDKSEESLNRIANIDEFVGLINDYFSKNPNDLLQDFLNHIPLYSEFDDVVNQECVSCMNIHTAKGLEFDYVFVIGLENGFFPLLREGSNLEEERRLAYVAFTRARKGLQVSYVDSRFYKGKNTELEPSEFLKEAGLLKKGIHHNQDEKIFCGDLVTHKIFGTGRVQEIRTNGNELFYVINFGGLVKMIMAKFIQKA